MRKPMHNPPKAYNNLEFLNSPEARTIRILAEFLEPMKRFRKEGIRDTIVVFGSARVLPGDVALNQLKKIVKQLSKTKNPPKALKEKLKKAEINLAMSGYYEDAATVTYKLTKWSKNLTNNRNFVVCSGGGPGIMEAANKGAIKAGGKSIGLNISLAFEQESNKYITKNLGFEFHYFFMRKFWFLYLAKAFILFPGGFGTFDELFEVLTLLQTRKVKKALPIVLYGRKYWNEILNFESLVKHNTISRN